MRLLFAFLFSALFIPLSLRADPPPYEFWFTGPLLAPTPINMQPGHPSIEGVVAVYNFYGNYDNHWKLKKQTDVWSISPIVDFQFGITDYLGIEIFGSSITNFRKGENSTHFQDTFLLLGYQISNEDRKTWVPDCRIFIEEQFPSGKYQKLDPKKAGIDSTGEGSYQTSAVIAVHKVFEFPKHYLGLELSLSYFFYSSRVSVRGFNAYGGGFDTKGTVRPGHSLFGFFSGEYSLTQNWVLSFDTQFVYQGKSRFSGEPGFISDPNAQTGSAPISPVGTPAFIQISFAPEIEYNFNANSGILAGIWFSVAGKNSEAFRSLFIAYIHTF